MDEIQVWIEGMEPCLALAQYSDLLTSDCFSTINRLPLTLMQPTVVTRAEPHNLRIVHPYENRVLTIRENGRSQVRSFPY